MTDRSPWDKGRAATPANGQRGYLAYQLRLWQARDGGALVWRASLKSAQTREPRSFASLDDLFEFLRQQTGASSGSDGSSSPEIDDSLPF